MFVYNKSTLDELEVKVTLSVDEENLEKIKQIAKQSELSLVIEWVEKHYGSGKAMQVSELLNGDK